MTSWRDRAGRDSVRVDDARPIVSSVAPSAGAERERRRRFANLYREHYPFVLRFALRRLRALDAAQDATVATFAVVWSRFDEAPPVPTRRARGGAGPPRRRRRPATPTA